MLQSLLLLACFSLASLPFAEAQSGEKVLLVKIEGYVGPGTHEAVADAIRMASEDKYTAILITIDTFGGLLDTTFKLIADIQKSKVPVIGYVYPAGKRALSAGTYLLMASDLAAMAPFTKIGSAQPVSPTGPVNDTKVIQALKKEMEGLALLHKRNVTQAIRFISHNDNLLPDDALRNRVIEAVADNPSDLLRKIDGHRVHTLGGEVTLQTKDARIIEYSPSPRSGIVSILSDPTISSILVGVGLFVLILGLSSPGFGAEIAGGIMILLGLLGQGFDVNYVALGLMAVGAGLIVFEITVPGHGAAGVGGMLILALGLMMFVTQPPRPLLISQEFANEIVLAIVVSFLVFGGLMAFMIYKILKVRRSKRYHAKEPKGTGRAVDEIPAGATGYVVVQGEYWKARSKVYIRKDSDIQIVGSEGNLLLVEPITTEIKS